MITRAALLAFVACSSSYQPPERDQARLAQATEPAPPPEPIPTVALTVGPWTHTELARGESLQGFGVLAGKLVANTNNFQRGASLWTLAGGRWEREALDHDASTHGFLAQDEVLVFTNEGFDTRTVEVRRGTVRDRSKLCGRDGQVVLARRGTVTWAAAECDRKLAVSRHADDASSWELLASVAIESTWATLVIDDAGLVHVAGPDADHEARHYMVDAAGARRVSLGTPVPKAITLAHCDGHVVGVFEHSDYTAAIGRLDGKTWSFGPREKVRVGSKFAFGPRCQAFAVDALGELWSHGRGGWTEVPGLAIGNLGFEEMAFFDDTIYVGYRRKGEIWVASAKLATSRSAADSRR